MGTAAEAEAVVDLDNDDLVEAGLDDDGLAEAEAGLPAAALGLAEAEVEFALPKAAAALGLAEAEGGFALPDAAPGLPGAGVAAGLAGTVEVFFFVGFAGLPETSSTMILRPPADSPSAEETALADGLGGVSRANAVCSI